MSQRKKISLMLPRFSRLITAFSMLAFVVATASAQTPTCNRTITADVVALDQVITYNRFGAFNPAGMLYALRRDVVPITGTVLSAGNAQLKASKRPRPIVLRVNEGDCLQVTFTNLLHPTPSNNSDSDPDNNTTATRNASMHVNGLDYVGSIASDGANVGQNASSLAVPGQTRVYTWYAAKPGQYMITSTGAPAGGEGDGGQVTLGLFGSVNVEPKNSVWYRSQVTGAQLAAATKKLTNGSPDLNPNGTPKINYDAVDANNTPILKMLTATNEIIHTDINAIVTDPDGQLDEDCSVAPPSSTCGAPFREFTVLFHDEIKAVQAFPELDQEILHGIRDGFAINYGSGAMGSIVLANRAGVGPAKNCAECKFEEFFLESWANNDPAMLVSKNAQGVATAALFPDDPSNVHHSYLGEPVRFRNIHIGPKETHVFHLHAHQWLQSPRDQNSTYLDSQTISPGAAFTYEINYGGSGNRNFTPGDSIFHCHLYPHFAQGMWELWRVHDVFEAGTPDRNLPDGEIAGGTPNPGLVPIPYAWVKNSAGVKSNLGMAPMPTPAFKGFPFYIEANAGHRQPQAPLDFSNDSIGNPLDGGLPRHQILAGQVVDGPGAIEPALLNDPVAARVLSQNNDPFLLGFARKLVSAQIELLPANGTPAEQAAMNFHAGVGASPFTTQYNWPAKAYSTFTPTGAAGVFLVNGRSQKAGAPFADPCPDTFKDSAGATRNVPLRPYRAAYIEFDMTVNTEGWHDRQARITVLEQDVTSTLNGSRAPEPLFFRANSGDCITFAATNLVPHALNLDDFQVFSPTDTIGQHIHLVKFDVTASDGAGNGWNYEDGTFSPGEVQERIEANNAFQSSTGGSQILHPKQHPVFGAGPDHDGNGVPDWLGAQTTIQRWWADPLINRSGVDRTIRTVFTHDHFGPSSHQHHGLYGGLVVEPTDSVWKSIDGNTTFGTRADGGPTSFQANIIAGANGVNSKREFNLEIADFAIVYTADLIPVNPPNHKEKPLPWAVGFPIEDDPSQQPTPEAISAADPGTMLINYRNEPLSLRISRSSGGAGGVVRTQKPGQAGDPAYAFSTAVHGDPFTPILKSYPGDRIQVRLLQGAQEEQHVLNIHANKWLFEPSSPNSGYTNSNAIGISEHFEFELSDRVWPAFNSMGIADFLYQSAPTENLWEGMWGLMRTFNTVQPDVAKLPNNNFDPASVPRNPLIGPNGINRCPTIAGLPIKNFTIQAWLAKDLVGPNGIVYNSRFGLKDPAGIVFINASDYAGIVAGTKKLEPLVMRVNAGDCIEVTLENKLPVTLPEYNSWNIMAPSIPKFNFNQVKTSNRVSLHPQLLLYDVSGSDGASIGKNPDTTVGPGQSINYAWYAGKATITATNSVTVTPIEFGVTHLRDYGDVIKHASHGAVGALVVQPAGSQYKAVGGTALINSGAAADIYNASNVFQFREFVLHYQDDLTMQTSTGAAVRNFGDEDDSEDSGQKAFNYRNEPFWARLGVPAQTDLGTLNQKDYTNIFSSTGNNPGCGGPCGDPLTPLFTAKAGTAVRFRVLQAAGHARQHGATLHGHHWNYEPWQNNSATLGNNPLTFEVGSYSHIGPTRHVNILTIAGGLFKIPGDYLYRTQDSFNISGGLWGIFRVTP